jgi:5-methylthioribose kinase
LPDLLSPEALPWLARRLHADPALLRLTSLGGGVSNHVLLAEAPGLRCVVKQALGRLRVAQEWLCTPTRIHREAAALRELHPLLPPGAVPGVLFEDFDHHVIAIEAAPEGARSWKDCLLAGEISHDTASRTGALHGAWLHHGAPARWRELFGDLAVFDDLRVDPYYRSTAKHHPDLSSRFEALIQKCLNRRISLTHGDLSPKNILVHGASVMLIDLEVIHFGDPAFDAAFLTNHLLLKAFHQPAHAPALAEAAQAYWRTLIETAGPEFDWLPAAAMEHLGGLMLARIDGKSPVEYLGEPARIQVRAAARELLESPAPDAAAAFERFFPCP